MSKAATLSSIGICVLFALPAQAGWIMRDNFNSYTNGNPITGNWTQRNQGSLHFLSNYVNGEGRAKDDNIAQALMTYSPAIHTIATGATRFDAYHSANVATENLASILAFNNNAGSYSYISAALESNSSSLFQTVRFYLVQDGVSQLGWTGMTDGIATVPLVSLGKTFTQAQVTTQFTTEMVGGTPMGRISLWLDFDFNDTTPADLYVTRGGIPLTKLGQEVGLAANGNATIDNFQTSSVFSSPEPSTLVLLIFGCAGLWARRR